MGDDLERMLTSTTPTDTTVPDLARLHRRGVRRRRLVRGASGGGALAVAVAVAIGVPTLVVPTGVEVQPSLGGGADTPASPPPDADVDPAPEPDPITDEERAVQSCMEAAGQRYDLIEDAMPPRPASPIDVAFLTDDLTDGTTQQAWRDEVEQRGWLGYDIMVQRAPTAESAHDVAGAQERHLMDQLVEDVEAASRADEDVSDRVNEEYSEVLAAYADVLTDCQTETYGYEVWTLEQRQALDELRGPSWSSAKTTGALANDPRVAASNDEFLACRQALVADELDEEQLRSQLDEIAAEAGLGTEGGRGLFVLADAVPSEVEGLEEFVEATREPTLELLACEQAHQDVVAAVAEELAPDHLAEHADELRELGIEVDLP